MSTSRKTILFFGDSLTFCFNAQTDDRFNKTERWTTLVENRFKDKFNFIVEGQGGRTIDSDDGIDGRNGKKSFVSALYSHVYLDYIFIMLGTNNLKERFRVSADEISNKFEIYDSELKKFCLEWECSMPKVVLIAPPKIKEGFINKDWGFVGAQEISNNLAGEYKKFTEKHGWDFIDASNIDVDPTDGVHLDFEGNKRIGELVTAYLEKELN